MFWTSLLGLVGLQYCSSPPFPYWLCLVVLSIIDNGILKCYWSTMYFSFQFCWFLLHILIFGGSVVRCMYIHNCYIFLLYLYLWSIFSFFVSCNLFWLRSNLPYNHTATHLSFGYFSNGIYFSTLYFQLLPFFFSFQLLCALIPKVSLLGEGGGRGVQDGEHM